MESRCGLTTFSAVRECVAFHRLQRTLASRLMCAYRTVLGVVDRMLACIPSFELHALYLSQVFCEIRNCLPDDPLSDLAKLRRNARKAMVRQWRAHMRDPRLLAPEVWSALGPVLRK